MLVLSGLPLDSQARTVSPQGSSYMFFHHDTKTHYAFLPLLCSELQGFRKTNRPLKILGARDLGQGFSCAASSVRVGHWGKRKRAALVVWGLPARHYKELPPFSVPSQCRSEPVEAAGEALLQVFDCRLNTEPRGLASVLCTLALVPAGRGELENNFLCMCNGLSDRCSLVLTFWVEMFMILSFLD